MIKSITIHHRSNDPSIPGELIASCPIVGIKTDYDSDPPGIGMEVEIKLPSEFTLPRLMIDVMIYGDNRYLGILILGPDGFSPHPDGRSSSFMIEIAPLLLPSPIDD